MLILRILVVALAVLLLPACGGGGGGGGGGGDTPQQPDIPIDPPPPTLEVMSPSHDTRYSRGGMIAVKYRARVPEGASIDAYGDKDGDPATTQDQSLLQSDVPDPGATPRVIALAAPGLQRSEFHIMLVMRRGETILTTDVSDGMCTFGDVSYVIGNGDRLPSPIGSQVAATPDGAIVTAGTHRGGALLGDNELNRSLELEQDDSINKAWIAKHDERGTPLWHVALGRNARVQSLEVDAKAIYVAGAFFGALAIHQPGRETEYAWAGEQGGMFLLSLNHSGETNWVRWSKETPPEGIARSVAQVRLAKRGSAGGVMMLMKAYANVFVSRGETDERLIESDEQRMSLLAVYDAEGALLGVETPGGAYESLALTAFASMPGGGALLGVKVRGTLAWRAANSPLPVNVQSLENDWDTGYLRLDSNGLALRGLLIPSAGTDGDLRHFGLTGHSDGSVTFATSFVPHQNLVLGQGTATERTVRAGGSRMIVLRHDALDRFQWALEYAIDSDGQFFIQALQLHALPGGGVALASNVLGAVEVFDFPRMFTREQDLFTMTLRADGTRQSFRLELGMGRQDFGDMAVMPDGSILITASFGLEGFRAGGRSLDGEPYNALVRVNGNGEFR